MAVRIVHIVPPFFKHFSSDQFGNFCCSMLILIFCFLSMLHVVRSYERAVRTTAKQLRFNHRVSFKIEEKSAVKLMAVVKGLFLLC